MPDTPGKRQRNALKAKRREAKDERRAARKAGAHEPSSPSAYELWQREVRAGGEPAGD